MWELVCGSKCVGVSVCELVCGSWCLRVSLWELVFWS